MKITKDQLATLNAAIVAATAGQLPAHAVAIRKDYESRKGRDPEMRIRWDALWCAIAQARRGAIPFQVQELEGIIRDLNDTHIDTALRKIVPPMLTA